MPGNDAPSEGGHGVVEGEMQLQPALVPVVLLLTFERWDENAGKRLTFGRWDENAGKRRTFGRWAWRGGKGNAVAEVHVRRDGSGFCLSRVW